MPATKEDFSVEKVVQDVRRILKEETNQEKKKKFVESVVNALSDGYGEGPNFEEICNAAAKLARSDHLKPEGTEEVEDALVANALPTEELDAEDLMKMPWMWCISLSQLKEIARSAENLYGRKWYENANMHQIVQEIIVPICARTKKGYWASQNPKGLKVTVFVTHSWNENFSEMVNSISSVFKNSLQEPNLWICAFALLQGDYNVIKSQVRGSDPSLQTSPFVQALEKADFFLVVRNSFGDLYSRIWCVCELMFAMEFNLVPSRTYITGPDDFADSTGGCMEAEASVEEDKEKILQHLTATLGREKVDEKIQEFRNLKLPSQINVARRLKFIIGFLVFVMVAVVVTLVIVFTRSSTQEKLRGIIEPELKEKLNAEKYSVVSHSYRRKALRWLIDQVDYKRMHLNDNDDILQKYCLLTFFHSTRGDRWTKKTNWEDDIAECNWYGINCAEGNEIIELSLPSNNLDGNIPVEIGCFRSLRVLDVSSNNIMSVPKEIGFLSALTSFWLHGNALTGRIPEKVNDLMKVIQKNYSAVILKKVQMTNKTALYNYGTSEFNSFQKAAYYSANNKEIAVTIENVWERYVLNIFYYRTNGDGWYNKGNWSSQISYCDWEGIVCNEEDEIISLVRFGSDLVGRIPIELGSLTKLIDLDLYLSPLSGTIPTEIGQLTLLRNLGLNFNQLTGTIPSELGRLEKLTRLALNDNSLSGTIPNVLCNNTWDDEPDEPDGPLIDCDDKIECECCVGLTNYMYQIYSCPKE